MFSRYIIIGAVSYDQGHYTSFIKKPNGWEVHNDLVKKIKKISIKAQIKPHKTMYVKKLIKYIKQNTFFFLVTPSAPKDPCKHYYSGAAIL